MEKEATNWWDKLGKPQYGGELVIRANRNIVLFDPYITEPMTNIHSAWLERLVLDDWTVDPAVFDFKTHWHPSQYVKGHLAENWEFTDPGIYVAHLRKGVQWQDIPPANGREFIADDVVFHFNRLCGLGGGFTKPDPFPAAIIAFKDLISVTAIDKYTVVFKWNIANPWFISETLHEISPSLGLENPEAVQKWGNLNDWHHAIGTGPFILQDFVADSSATLIKNPNYWGHDERHPQNKLPYIDTVKYLIIPDDAAALAAMRDGKIDVIDHISAVQAQAMRKTNPEILQTPVALYTITIDPRNDVAPFNDIRVRQAMQMAIDLPAIAKSYYHGSVEPYPSTLTSTAVKGWGFPYDEWPRELKDEYAYNPAAAKQLLADAGYPNGFKTNIVVETAVDMDLLKIVKSYFVAVGIDMEIRTMDYPDWVTFVKTGHKHDQLAQSKYGPLGHNSAPFHDLTRFHKGGHTAYLKINDPVFDALYAKAMITTTTDEMKKVMRDANERIARQHYVISLLQPVAYSLCQPWLKGFSGQYGSIFGANAGPGMLSFYLGRFWIDRNLKKFRGP